MTPEVIKFPFGDADTPTVTLTGGAATIEAANTLTIVDFGTLGEDATLNVTHHKDLMTGAQLMVKATSDGTARSVTFGTGITGALMSGTISKTKTKLFVFDGTAFISTNEQID